MRISDWSSDVCSSDLVKPQDYGQVFELGNARLSLHSAGHILGSAQVRIEVDGQVWVVSGDYKRDDDPSCAPFEVVPCDVFVTEATFGAPPYVWPPDGTARDRKSDGEGKRVSVSVGPGGRRS